MSRLLKIAVREYLAYVQTIGFWVSMASVPMVATLAFLGPILANRATPPSAVAVYDVSATPPRCARTPCPHGGLALRDAVVGALAATRHLVVVQPPAALDANMSASRQRAILEPFLASEESSLRPLDPRTLQAGTPMARRLDFAVILIRDADPTHPVTVRIWSRNVGGGIVGNVVEDAVADWTRTEALRALGVTQDRSDAIMRAEPRVENYALRGSTGPVQPRDWLPTVAGLAMAGALWAASMTGASLLLNSVIEEKSSRILEVLLTSASVPEIIGGKILGVAMVTTTVLGVWSTIGGLALGNLPSTNLGDVASVLFAHGLIFYFLFYFVAGYLMYATIFVTIGAFCETAREAQTLLGPMMMVLIIPMLFVRQLIMQPDSPLLRAFSWFPLFTPFMMAARASSQPPWWEVLGTGTLLIATVAGALWIAGRAFRSGALSTSRFNLGFFLASIAGRSQA